MERFSIKDPQGETFEVTRSKLARLISQGWKLVDPAAVLIKPKPVDTTVLETADVSVVIVEEVADEPHAAKNEDKADDSDAKASAKKAK